MDSKSGKRMFEGEEIPELQPTLFTGGVLRSYQIQGFQWLKVGFSAKGFLPLGFDYTCACTMQTLIDDSAAKFRKRLFI